MSGGKASRMPAVVDPVGSTARPAWRLWGAALILLVTILQRETSFVPWKVFLPILLVTLCVVMWRASDTIRKRDAVIGGCLLTALLLVGAVPFVLTPTLSSAIHLSLAAAPVAAAGVFLLLVLPGGPAALNGAREPQVLPRPVVRQPWFGSVLLVTTFVVFAAVHWSIQRDYVSFYDEPLYVLQGKLMAEPGYTRPIDPSLGRFFVLRQTIFDEGRFYTQYTPGLPVLLALFDAFGLRWWTGVVASTVGVYFTYLIGRDVHSVFAGRVAALLLAANQYFMAYGTSFMPHGPELALLTAAAWLVLRSERRAGWRPFADWWAAGVLLGLAVTVRPLTGAALAISVCLWQFGRRTIPWRVLVTRSVWLLFGFVPPILALMHYNAVTNGTPWLFGYTAAHGALHDLGFGLRGFIVPDASGHLVSEPTNFTPRRAVAHGLIVLSGLADILLPVALLLPALLIAGYRFGYAIRWRTLGAFLVLPALQFAYFYPHRRFYLELFPFLFTGVAGAIDHLRRHDRSLALAILVPMLAAQVLVAALDVQQRTDERQRAVRHAVIAAVRDAHEAEGKVLVFVRGEGLLHWLSWFNIDAFPGDVIVARDLGVENSRLRERFPDHVPLRVAGTGQAFQLSRLE